MKSYHCKYCKKFNTSDCKYEKENNNDECKNFVLYRKKDKLKEVRK